MARLFHSVGFSSTDKLVECTISDMVSDTIGSSRSKTKDLVEQNLGTVLFVKDAHHLSDPGPEEEAAKALQTLMRQHERRIVIILSGEAEAMDYLLYARPMLRSMCQHHITFRQPRPEECVDMLHRTLQDHRFEAPYLLDKNNDSYLELGNLFEALLSSPTWSNARDIELLEKSMRRKAILDSMKDSHMTQPRGGDTTQLRTLPLSESQAISCVRDLLQRRIEMYDDERKGPYAPRAEDLFSTEPKKDKPSNDTAGLGSLRELILALKANNSFIHTEERRPADIAFRGWLKAVNSNAPYRVSFAAGAN